MANTHIAAIQVIGTDDIRVEVAETVGPLGAFRSSKPAERLLASFADCVTDEVVDQRVDKVVDLDGKTWFVALFEYNRPVRVRS